MGQRQKIKRLGFDTNFFIHHFENKNRYSIKIIEWIFINRLIIHLSNISFTELLTLPIKDNNIYLIELYKEMLNQSIFNNLDVDLNIVLQAAELRAEFELETPDAIHLATGIQNNYDVFITEDKHLLKLKSCKGVDIFSIKSFYEKVVKIDGNH